MSYNLGVGEVPVLIDNKQANGSITEGAVLKWYGSGDFDIVSVATLPTDAPVGVARATVASGERVSILRAGRAVVSAVPGGTITQGAPAYVQSGGTGQVTTWVSGATTINTWQIGQFDFSATANSSGQHVPVMLGFSKLLP